MKRDALFSENGKYRYQLIRDWSGSATPKTAVCIGLNPSTANHELDDPTIHALCEILKNLGFGKLIMTNLYSLISSKPEALFNGHDALLNNDEWLKISFHQADTIICCWGQFKGIEYRVKKVREIIPENIPLKCFGKNKNGTPTHPMAFRRRGTNLLTIKLIDFSR